MTKPSFGNRNQRPSASSAVFMFFVAMTSPLLHSLPSVSVRVLRGPFVPADIPPSASAFRIPPSAFRLSQSPRATPSAADKMDVLLHPSPFVPPCNSAARRSPEPTKSRSFAIKMRSPSYATKCNSASAHNLPVIARNTSRTQQQCKIPGGRL